MNTRVAWANHQIFLASVYKVLYLIQVKHLFWGFSFCNINLNHTSNFRVCLLDFILRQI